MEKPGPADSQFQVSPLKAALIAAVVLGGMALGTWLTLPKMDERGRAQQRVGRGIVDPDGASTTKAAPLILDGDFVWMVGEGGAGFWIGRYTAGREELAAFATATGEGVELPAAASGRVEVRVTADAARLYCDWLSRTTGFPHRIPTDAEWMRYVGAGAGESSTRANASGIYPSLHPEWVTLPDSSAGSAALRPPGEDGPLGAFRVVRTGTPPVRQ